MSDKKSDNIKRHEPEEKIEKSDTVEAKAKTKFYKKIWFWVVFVLSTALIGLGIFSAIYFTAQSANKKVVSNGWGDIVRQSNVLCTLGEAVVDQASFDKYNSELQKLNSILKDKKINTSKLSFRAKDVQRYQKFLNDFGSYTDTASGLAGKISDYTDSDNEKLKVLSMDANESSNDVRNNIKYLTESMPDLAFKIQDVFTLANKVILSKALAIQAQEQAAQAQSAKDKADKQAVENNTGNYLNAFIAGNAANMRRYMTSAFQAEYDFSQVAADTRTVVYPASFRILLVSKIDSTHYKSQVNVLYKYRDGSGQYTVGDELNFVYDSPSASWLVNSVRESSAF